MVRRLSALSVVLIAVALFSLPLAATTTTAPAGEGGTTAATDAGEGTGTTEATAPAEMIQPAVTVDTTPVAETNPDWTYRFFIPTLLVLAVLVVIVTVIQYFTRVVRNRYRIVR